MSHPLTLEQEQAAILEGLEAEQKFINPKYFYNHHGSKLFEKITQLDEYYPTRTERDILKGRAGDIANLIEKNAVIIEPGAGSCKKKHMCLRMSLQNFYNSQQSVYPTVIHG